MAKRMSEVDRIAAEQIASRWVAANLALMQLIAGACHADAHEITGPAVDAVASILSRDPDPACNGSNADPACNVALITDYCRRELSPRGPTIDPQSVETHGGSMHPMNILRAMFYDAPVVTCAGADDDVPPLEQQPVPVQGDHEAAAAVAALIDRGQNHRNRDHRQKEKAAAARAAGQLWFCGLDWRSPPSNDDDFDGGVPA